MKDGDTGEKCRVDGAKVFGYPIYPVEDAESVRAEMAQALAEDCENGVKWFSERAVEQFRRDFPKLSAVMQGVSGDGVKVSEGGE